MTFKVIIPQSNPTDGSGRFSREWQLFLLNLANALNAAGTVTNNEGDLTSPAIILGGGGADLRAGPLPVKAGYVLTDNGPGNDPSYLPSTGGGITTLTNDVLASGTGSVSAALNLANRHEWTATQNVGQVPLADASTVTPNGALSNNFYLLMTTGVGSTRTINVPTSLSPGDKFNLEIQNSASGGCSAIFAAGYTWGSGGSASQPIASSGASASEFYSCTYLNAGNVRAQMAGSGGPSGAGYGGTSVTSQGTGTGSKTFVTQAGKAWLPTQRVRAGSASTGELMEGPITSYAAGSMVIAVDYNTCTTTHTDWNISAAGQIGATGSTGSPGSSNFLGTSTTSLTITTGSQSFTTQSGLAFQVGARIRVSDSAAPANYFEGLCTAYSGTSCTVLSDTFGGSGTFTTWNLNISGNPGTGGTTIKVVRAQGDATGSINVTGTSFANLGHGLSVTIAAAVNDNLDMHAVICALGGGAGTAYLSLAFAVAGTAVAPAVQYETTGAAIDASVTVLSSHKVVAGDISGGVVTVTLQAEVDAHTAVVSNSGLFIPQMIVQNSGP